ncbi:MAG: hypothetical protein H7333_07975 [Bdellovibrionales bacterium]|nr:hypothetical protein [Oligoflexia bacterium]
MKTPEQAMIAIVVTRDGGAPVLAETLTSSEEILELELAMMNREPEPLKRVHDFRQKASSEDEEFADFVEGLLSQPFVKPDVQSHAVQWFKSRTKIEAYQKAEDDASRVIAQYAFQVFTSDSSKVDFLLAGPKAKVRIKVIDLSHYQKPMAA